MEVKGSLSSASSSPESQLAQALATALLGGETTLRAFLTSTPPPDAASACLNLLASDNVSSSIDGTFVDVTTRHMCGAAHHKKLGGATAGDNLHVLIKYMHGVVSTVIEPKHVQLSSTKTLLTDVFTATNYVLANTPNVPRDATVHDNADLCADAALLLSKLVSCAVEDAQVDRVTLLSTLLHLCPLVDDRRHAKPASTLWRALLALGASVHTASPTDAKVLETLRSIAAALQARLQRALTDFEKTDVGEADLTLSVRLARFYWSQLGEWRQRIGHADGLRALGEHVVKLRCLDRIDALFHLRGIPFLESCFTSLLLCVDAGTRDALLESCGALSDSVRKGTAVEPRAGAKCALVCAVLSSVPLLRILDSPRLLTLVQRLAALLPSLHIDACHPQESFQDRCALLAANSGSRALSLQQHAYAAVARVASIVVKRRAADLALVEALVWRWALDPHWLVSQLGVDVLAFMLRRGTTTFRAHIQDMLIRHRVVEAVGLADAAISGIFGALSHTCGDSATRNAFQSKLLSNVQRMRSVEHRLRVLAALARGAWLPRHLLSQIGKSALNADVRQQHECIAALECMRTCVRSNTSALDEQLVARFTEFGSARQSRGKSAAERAAATRLLGALLRRVPRRDASNVIVRAVRADTPAERVAAVAVAAECGHLRQTSQRENALAVDQYGALFKRLWSDQKQELLCLAANRACRNFSMHSDCMESVVGSLNESNKAQFVQYLRLGDASTAPDHMKRTSLLRWRESDALAVVRLVAEARARRIQTGLGVAEFMSVASLLEKADTYAKTLLSDVNDGKLEKKEAQDGLKRVKYDIERWLQCCDRLCARLADVDRLLSD